MLSEDKNFDLLKVFFESSGFDNDHTEYFSYEGANNINGAITLAKYIKGKKPSIKVVIHRDRDYLSDSEVNEFKRKSKRADVFLFITSGVDIESHFLNPQHIASIYPDLTLDYINAQLSKATEKSERKSLDTFINQTLS